MYKLRFSYRKLFFYFFYQLFCYVLRVFCWWEMMNIGFLVFHQTMLFQQHHTYIQFESTIIIFIASSSYNWCGQTNLIASTLSYLAFSFFLSFSFDFFWFHLISFVFMWCDSTRWPFHFTLFLLFMLSCCEWWKMCMTYV